MSILSNWRRQLIRAGRLVTDNLQSDDKCLPLLALQRHHSKRNSASASDRDIFPSSLLMSCTYRRRPRKELKEVEWTKPTRVGEGITQRRAALRLCNLVAPGHTRCLRRSLSRKSKKGTDSAGDRSYGRLSISNRTKSQFSVVERYGERSANAGKRANDVGHRKRHSPELETYDLIISKHLVSAQCWVVVVQFTCHTEQAFRRGVEGRAKRPTSLRNCITTIQCCVPCETGAYRSPPALK